MNISLLIRSLACLCLLSIGALAPLQAQNDTSENWEEHLEQAMEHLQEVLEMKHEQIAALQEEMSEVTHHELEVAMKELEKSMKITETELKEMEKHIREEVEMEMATVEVHMQEMEGHFKEAEEKVHVYERELKEELVSDGLIDNLDSHMNIEHKGDQIYLNDKALSPELNQKYLKVLDEFSEKVEEAFRMKEAY